MIKRIVENTVVISRILALTRDDMVNINVIPNITATTAFHVFSIEPIVESDYWRRFCAEQHEEEGKYGE